MSFQSSAFSRQLIYVVLSSAFLIVAFPNFNLSLLAWIGLVPLLFAIEGERPFKAFLLSYIHGIIFFLGTVYWLIHVTLPGMLLVVLYLALYFGAFGYLVRYLLIISSRDMEINGFNAQLRLLFFIPAVWAVLEWLRSHLLTGFGWVLLGYSQSPLLPIIQIADIFGVYGVSFLIAMINVAIFIMVKNFHNKKGRLTPLVIAGFFLILSLGYGYLRLYGTFTGEKIKITVVQGNIPQDQKWDAHFRNAILDQYERLTREAAKEKTDIVIWPETAVPGFLESEKDILDRVKKMVTDIHTPLLVGTPREQEKEDGTHYYNSAVLLLDDGRSGGQYDKIHLVPFGEYIPLRNIFSFVEKFSRMPIGDFSAGKDYEIFKFFVTRNSVDKDTRWKLIKKVSFGCLICFEDIFPDLTRNFVKKNASLLVNITNDAWFGYSSAPYQHAQNSVFRAVENRVNVIRAANTGLSCFIDEKGRIVGSVKAHGKELFVEGYASHEVVLSRTRTLYTIYGDIFIYFCILSLLTYVTGIARTYSKK